jgi:flavin reductase (DIM6/NTAB) family NADH-FMN oxidoreductase RutF
MVITAEELREMAGLRRVQFATTLPGPKPICLVGTRSAAGLTNLAPFSSITHLGSSPMLIGMVTRPDTVERHTLRNILETRSWTLNHVTAETLQQAHQCSARYPHGLSEFSATGLTEHYHPSIHAPFVAECLVRYALTLEEITDIAANGTKLIIGTVTLVELPTHLLAADGTIDLVGCGSLASTALDTYFSLTEPRRIALPSLTP